jgi:hypothetical protein
MNNLVAELVSTTWPEILRVSFGQNIYYSKTTKVDSEKEIQIRKQQLPEKVRERQKKILEKDNYRKS